MRGKRGKYNVIAFYCIDPEMQLDGFYLHELDDNVGPYKADEDYEWEVIGSTDQPLEEFSGI